MKGDPRYAETNALWAATAVPPTTAKQARLAEKLILREFGSLKDFPAAPGSRILLRRGGARRVWMNTKPGTLYKGLPRLAHDVSHRIARIRHPRERPHCDAQAYLELRITRFTIETVMPAIAQLA